MIDPPTLRRIVLYIRHLKLYLNIIFAPDGSCALLEVTEELVRAVGRVIHPVDPGFIQGLSEAISTRASQTAEELLGHENESGHDFSRAVNVSNVVGL